MWLVVISFTFCLLIAFGNGSVCFAFLLVGRVG